MTRSVLFLGGTGIISAGSVALAHERGWQVTALNRGQSLSRPLPEGVEVVTGDVRDVASVRGALGDRTFDVVADFLSYTPDQLGSMVELFGGRTGQYVYISSASAYQTPPRSLPVTEGTTLSNPIWQYSRDKIAGEELLVRKWRDERFPMTIVRPSHTYDQTSTILGGGRAMVRRVMEGRPVIVHGDGSSLWTLTHTSDFAKAFVGLFGQYGAVGEAFHITSDEALTWDAITRLFADAAGTDPQIIHVTSDQVAAVHQGWGEALLGDKGHSMVFDNTKVKRLVPDFVCTTSLSAGVRTIIDYFADHPETMPTEADLEPAIETLVQKYGG
ncbi:MAG TPA: NAD-dependent epimerase/dehydratase family protein [Propionibacteriaceae bacterium]|nr:NAD-dependent epimerase/dehydratase family protein [Propionibacteriaceae bacterium]HQE32756.1 NAD-dependent epimerase/dehydratase family protein [Propionibacteriaceae bacterium]